MFENMLYRRDFLKMASVGALAASSSVWFDVLASRAAEAGGKHKSCILLWMQGGPAQSHTWDLKAGSSYKPISTTVPGIQISEHLPKIAKQMKDMVLLRSMNTVDGNHRTAQYLMHTGYRKGSGGGLTHPSIGAMAASDLGDPNFELPNFVAVGNTLGPGYLGPKHSPVIVNDFDKGLADLKPFTDMDDVDGKASLIEELDKAFMNDYQAQSINAHLTAYQRALALMRSNKTKAFDLNNEPTSVRDAYGKSRFGQGCLLARRLVEAGVAFVEVSLGSWDTHNNADGRVKALSEQLDPGMATLIGDLKERGLLDSTLVICMGEFGRSPGNGSAHYAKAWTAVLAGGGIKGGQVVGSTGPKGAEADKRPINSPDFMATVCKAIGIDVSKDYMAKGGRPMTKVDKNAKLVKEVFA